MSPPPTDTRRRRPTGLVVAVLCLCGTIVSLQQTLVVPLLPDYPRILGTSAENASWLVTATLLTSAVATPIIAKAADMYGKRRMLLLCLVVMLAGSVLAAMSNTLPPVIAGRCLQGFAAALIPVGISIMRDELPSERVGGAVALMSATLGIGAAIGTPLAGVLYEHYSWHMLFWVSAASAAVFVVLVPLVVPESSVRSPGTFDVLGAILLSGALVSLLLAISKGGHWGWTSPTVVGLVVVGVGLLAAWAPLELRVSSPMVDLRTSARRPVLLTNIASLLVGFAMFANMLSTTQQLQMPTATGYGLGLGVLEAGLCMLPAGLLMVVLAPVSARLSRAFGARVTLLSGALVMAFGYLVRVFLTDSLWHIVLGSAVVSAGTALAYAVMPTLIMRSVPITETASANGLNSLLRAVGTSTSSATLTAVLAASTMQVGALTFPTLAAFQHAFVIAGAMALGAAGVAAMLPSRRLGAPVSDAAAASSTRNELLIGGRVCTLDGLPQRQAVVSVLTSEGGAVDWARTDNDGRFSVAVPSPGDYLVVGVNDGWAPQSCLRHLDRDSRLDLTLTQPLAILGQILAGPDPQVGALVALTSRAGEVAGTAISGLDGSFAMPLPPAGRYVITAVSGDRRLVASRHLTIIGQARVFNIDLLASGDAALVDSITGAQVLHREFPTAVPGPVPAALPPVGLALELGEDDPLRPAQARPDPEDS
ncbi:MAG: MFS transporter [Actinomycetales bacterium]